MSAEAGRKRKFERKVDETRRAQRAARERSGRVEERAEERAEEKAEEKAEEYGGPLNLVDVGFAVGFAVGSGPVYGVSAEALARGRAEAAARERWEARQPRAAGGRFSYLDLELLVARLDLSGFRTPTRVHLDDAGLFRGRRLVVEFEPARKRSPGDQDSTGRDGRRLERFTLFHSAPVPELADEDEALRFVLGRLLYVAEHEVREMFLLRPPAGVGGEPERAADPHDPRARLYEAGT